MNVPGGLRKIRQHTQTLANKSMGVGGGWVLRVRKQWYVEQRVVGVGEYVSIINSCALGNMGRAMGGRRQGSPTCTRNTPFPTPFLPTFRHFLLPPPHGLTPFVRISRSHALHHRESRHTGDDSTHPPPTPGRCL